MSSWQDREAAAIRAIISVWPSEFLFTPQDGSDPYSATGTIIDPVMLDNFSPGSSQGTSVLHAEFYGPDFVAPPSRGDTMSVNGQNYILFEDAADYGSKVTLKFRRNA